MGDSRLAKWFIRAELEALRGMAELTPGGLAELLGYTTQSIMNWETGVNVPRRSVVKDICDVAGAEESRKRFLLFVVDNYKKPDLVANLHTRNVRMVEQGERTAGDIFKFEPEFIPGPLQLPSYHNEVLSDEGQHSEFISSALKRKLRRGRLLESRRDLPQIQVLIGYNALRHLRFMVQWERQIEVLLAASERPNWEIRVIDGLHRASRGNFDLYKPGNSPEAGPAFVYTESLDQSRYLEDAVTVRWYDQLRSEIWDMGEPIKETFSGGIQLLA